MPNPSNTPSKSKKKHHSTAKDRAGTAKANYISTFKVAAEGKQKHGKSVQTRNNYSGHIRRGIEFLADFAREEQEAEEIWQNAEDGSNHLSAENENEILRPKWTQIFISHSPALRLGVPLLQL